MNTFLMRGAAIMAIALVVFSHAGAEPQRELPVPYQPPAEQPGGEWIGRHVELGHDDHRLQRATPRPKSSQPYTPDPRVLRMIEHAERAREAALREADLDREALQVGEERFRHAHHAPEPTSADAVVGAAAAKQAPAPVAVRIHMRSAATGRPVGGFMVWNDTTRRWHTVPADATLATDLLPDRTLWLHVAPPAPMAMTRVAIEPLAGVTEYVLQLVDGEPLEIAYVAPANGRFDRTFTVSYAVGDRRFFGRSVPADGIDRIAIPAGVSLHAEPFAPSPYYADPPIVEIDTRRARHQVDLHRGALLTFQLPVEARVTVTAERGFSWGRSESGTSAPQLLVPVGRPMRIHVAPTGPWLPQTLRGQTFTTDTTLPVLLERGVPVVLRLQNEQQAPTVAGVSAVGLGGEIHEFAFRTDGETVVVPRDVPVRVDATAFAGAEGRFLDAGTLTLRKESQAVLSGRLTQLDGKDAMARIEAWREGVKVASVHAVGRYRLELPTGDYEMHVFTELLTSGVAPVQVTPVALTSAGEHELDLAVRATDGSWLRLMGPTEAPGCEYHRARTTVRLDAEGVRPATRMPAESGAAGFGFQLISAAPGRYAATIDVPGHRPLRLDAIELNANETTAVLLDPEVGRCSMWTGTLRDADGAALPNRPFHVFGPHGLQVVAGATDAAGQFAIPMSDAHAVEFQAPAEGTTLGALHPLAWAHDGRHGDITLPSLPPLPAFEPRQGVPQLVFGDAADPSRLNVVFVADGYVGTRERFDDRNGNGMWDGVLFADLNRNGVWDSHEPYSVYGAASRPSSSVSGTDITQNNEPFTDLNDDGYPSIDDPSVFGKNVQDFLRAWLSRPPWSEYRGALNAWVLWFDSPQAGMTLLDRDEAVLLRRDTAFSAQWSSRRSLLAVDYQRVHEEVRKRLPRARKWVALINQPVFMGRANSAIVYNGGVHGHGPNSGVASHEFGHAIGQLADEYEEHAGNYTGLQPMQPNSSRYDDPHYLKWFDLIRGEPALHSGEPGLGIFEGSGYYSGGLFRPSNLSAMRSSMVPLFNAPSLRAIAAEMCHRTGHCRYPHGLRSGVWWRPDESGWGLFVFDQGNLQAVAWFTYDEDGRPSWFMIPAFKVGDELYAGDILRVRGHPYPSINGPAAIRTDVVGRARLRYRGGEHLRFDYTVGTVSGGKVLQPFAFPDAELACAVADGSSVSPANFSDVWWNPDESGWGLFIVHVGAHMFVSWYTFDHDGRALFMHASVAPDAHGYSGTLYRQRDGTRFSAIDGQSPSPAADAIGSVALRFDDANAGEFAFTVGEHRQRRPIQRLRVGHVPSQCRSVPSGGG